MPKYESVCKTCGKQHEYTAKIDDRNNTPECCNKPTERAIFTPPMGFVDGPAAGGNDGTA